MNKLVSFKVPLLDENGMQEFGDDIMPLTEERTGELLYWGIDFEEISDKIAQFTVVFVQESESGQIIKLLPEEITIL